MPTRTFTLSASALLLTFALSACGANAVPASTNVALPSPLPINVPASPVALADASAAPATADGLLSEQEAHRFGDLPAFTGPAADKFGADNVMAAYKEMVVMAEDYGFTANLMTSHAYRPEEFRPITKFMTAETVKVWEGLVVKAIAGDPEGISGVEAITSFNSSGRWKVTLQKPAFTSPVISEVSTWVDTSRTPAALALGFTVTGDLHFMRDGKAQTEPITRELSLYLVPSGDPTLPWLLDGWKGTASGLRN